MRLPCGHPGLLLALSARDLKVLFDWVLVCTPVTPALMHTTCTLHTPKCVYVHYSLCLYGSILVTIAPGWSLAPKPGCTVVQLSGCRKSTQAGKATKCH
jgi:hypothetical protein